MTYRIMILLFLGVFFSTSTHYSSQNTIKEGEQSMEEIILSLENGAMERWRHGDPWGWTEISAEEITYH